MQKSFTPRPHPPHHRAASTPVPPFPPSPATTRPCRHFVGPCALFTHLDLGLSRRHRRLNQQYGPHHWCWIRRIQVMAPSRFGWIRGVQTSAAPATIHWRISVWPPPLGTQISLVDWPPTQLRTATVGWARHQPSSSLAPRYRSLSVTSGHGWCWAEFQERRNIPNLCSSSAKRTG